MNIAAVTLVHGGGWYHMSYSLWGMLFSYMFPLLY